MQHGIIGSLLQNKTALWLCVWDMVNISSIWETIGNHFFVLMLWSLKLRLPVVL